tara:strand:+ start:329 stop:544 length:216 start_codon:yes stop_codon:yes gene_type:complete
MTQKEFDTYFKNEVLPIIARQYEADGIPDRPARREAYNNELDNSHRSGQITDDQVNNWCISDNLETTEYWL